MRVLFASLLLALLVGPTLPLVASAGEDAGGLFEILGPDGRSLGTTHGPDPIPALAPPGILPPPRRPACVDGSVPGDTYAVVIYARAHDDADRYASKAPVVRDLVERANALVNDAAMRSGGVTADIKLLCVRDALVVREEVLPTPLADSSFASIVTDLRAKGYTDPRVKQWVYFDDTSACTCGGTGHIYSSATPTPASVHNGVLAVPMFAVTFGYDSVRIMLHELSHTMGAVQSSAPHSTRGGHCWDGRDTMCYADDGVYAYKYTTSACAVEVYDCGNDDYCHASPAPGSYLSRNWNVCSVNNRHVVMGNDPTRALVLAH